MEETETEEITPEEIVTTPSPSAEEGTPTETEKEDSSDLYGSGEDITTTAEPEYVDFSNDEELSIFKDIFDNSRITTGDFEKFQQLIADMSSVKEFSKIMTESYGNEAATVLKDYQTLTNDIFTPQEKETLNRLPAYYKNLMVKLGKTLGDRYNKLKQDYGITSQETQALPEYSAENLNERFNKLTERLLNGGLTSEEYQRIKQERLELAKHM